MIVKFAKHSITALIPFVFMGVVSSSHGQAVAPIEKMEIYNKYLKYGSMVKGGRIKAHWMADGSSFWYAEGDAENRVIYRFDAATEKIEPFFDVPRLRKAISKVLGHSPPHNGVPFAAFSLIDEEQAIQFTLDKGHFRLNLGAYVVESLSSEEVASQRKSAPKIIRNRYPRTIPPLVELPSPDGKSFATVKDNNVWIRSADNDLTTPLTEGGRGEYPWSITQSKWSSDSKFLAVQRTNIQAVHKVPVVDWLGLSERVEYVTYPQSAGAWRQAELYLFDVAAGRSIRIDIGTEDFYLYAHGFTNDDSEFLFFRLDRLAKRLDFIAVDVLSGKTRTIMTERSKTFLYYPEDLSIPITMLKDGGFIWQSERDGWNHLYHYGSDGKLIRQLTAGEFRVGRVVHVDEELGFVYFMAQTDPKRVYDVHLQKVALSGGESVQLTNESGYHLINFSPSGKFYLDRHSSVTRPPRTELRRADGALHAVVSEANIDELLKIGWRVPEEFTVKAADEKTDLRGVLYKPFDFSPDKSYPVIEVIYGGPQVTLAPNTFVPRALGPLVDLANALSQLGYISVVLDARGTPGRSKEFQDVVYMNLGRYEITDHAAALRNLAADRPYMNLDRVGVYGQSYGGYFALRALLQEPDLYKVGVASAPIEDMPAGSNEPLEPYLGLVQDNPGGYEYARNAPIVDKFTGRILFMVGTHDVNTPFSHTMKLADAFIRADKPYDLVIMPGQNHYFMYEDSTYPSAYWFNSVRRYFLEHLAP